LAVQANLIEKAPGSIDRRVAAGIDKTVDPDDSPVALAKGPPLLPGLMAASVWIMSR